MTHASSRVALVLVANDAAVADPAEDRAGPLVVDALNEAGWSADRRIVGAADAREVGTALDEALPGARLVVTCGGTGIRPDDVLVDVVTARLTASLPGIGEEIRRRGAALTPAALLSRVVAGIVDHGGGRTVVVTAPSSRGGARDTVAVLLSVWEPLERDLVGQERH